MKLIIAFAIAAGFAVVATGLVACNNPTSTTVSPPPPPPPPPGPPPAPFPVKSIQIGEVVTGQLKASDPGCPDFIDPMDTGALAFPCQEYRVSVPGAGTLSMHLAWTPQSGEGCVAASPFNRHCLPTPPVDVSVPVSGDTFLFAVESVAGLNGVTRTYSLTTSFAAATVASAR